MEVNFKIEKCRTNLLREIFSFHRSIVFLKNSIKNKRLFQIFCSLIYNNQLSRVAKFHPSRIKLVCADKRGLIFLTLDKLSSFISVFSIFQEKTIARLNCSQQVTFIKSLNKSGHLLVYSGESSLWDVHTFTCVYKQNKKIEFGLIEIDRSLICFFKAERSNIYIFDIIKKKVIFKLKGHHDKIDSLIELSGSRILSVGKVFSTKVWDTQTGECLGDFNRTFDNPCLFQGDLLINIEKFLVVKIWDSKTRTLLREVNYDYLYEYEEMMKILSISQVGKDRIVFLLSRSYILVSNFDLDNDELFIPWLDQEESITEIRPINERFIYVETDLFRHGYLDLHIREIFFQEEDKEKYKTKLKVEDGLLFFSKTEIKLIY